MQTPYECHLNYKRDYIIQINVFLELSNCQLYYYYY